MGIKQFFNRHVSEVSRYWNIIWYRTYAQLKSESRQNYLGFIWFLIEPILMTTILYLVFGVLLNNKSADFVLFILVGITIWHWFEAGVTEGMLGIRAKLHIMNQIALPKYIFPCVHILTVSIKFLFVFFVILLFSWIAGYKVTIAYLGLVPLLLTQLMFISGIATTLAIFVTYYGDLTKVVAVCMRLLFYLSGIFFSANVVPEDLKFYFDLNPITSLINGYRDVLIEGAFPNAEALLYVMVIAFLSNILGISVCAYFDKKLLKAVAV